ncbi:MAG: DUF1080 domain-containing protein [Verrucomicrobiales bacterium]|nr:DUF1080 domain-containing protein [Verrucomicrobiales bacterium]
MPISQWIELTFYEIWVLEQSAPVGDWDPTTDGDTAFNGESYRKMAGCSSRKPRDALLTGILGVSVIPWSYARDVVFFSNSWSLKSWLLDLTAPDAQKLRIMNWFCRNLAARCSVALAVGVFAAVAAEAPEWQPLFNGKDLTGWQAFHDAKFEVNDAQLRLVKGTGWLRTDKAYRDFVLEVEVRPRVERYDSGFFFRAAADGKPWPADAWQINLRRDMWGALVHGTQRIMPATVEGPDIDDETPWSKFRLELRGTRAVLELNGKKVWETDKIDRPSGYIGIQAEERSFDFRNFRIQASP